MILAIGALVVATLAQIIVGLALPSLRPNYLKAFVRDLGDVSGVAENGTVTVPRIADAIYEKVTEDNRNVLFVLHEVVVDSFKRFAVIKSRQDEQTDITTSLQEDVATAKRALGEKADVSEIRRLERVLADKQMSVHARMDRFESALDKATDMSFPPRVPGVVNFLGIGMGAGVFPPLTSTSTAMPSRSRIQEFFSRSMDQSHIDEASKAMNKWSEQGECWCTPVVNGSQWAIYSVADPHVTKVQMEFISSTKAETRHHMRSAPRLFEIWALDPKLRNRPNDMVWQDKSHLTIRSSWKRDYFRDYRKLAL